MTRLIDKKFFIILLLTCIIFISVLVLYKHKYLINKELFTELKLKIANANLIKKVSGSPPFRKGENLIFRLDLGFLTIGRSNLTFEGKTELNGKEVYLIKFVTHAINFHDTEKIYAEIGSFLPLRIEREIKMFGRKIDIVEEYNQKEKFVKIIRTESGKTTEQILQSDKEIDSILCLIYFYRMPNELEIGKKMSINLPLKYIEIEVEDIKSVNMAKGRFEAYVLRSQPKGYNFLFDTGDKKLPLSINGAINFGNVKMVLTDFSL